MTHLTQISHMVMSDYWLLTIWNSPLSPAQLQSGQKYIVPFFSNILCTLRFTHMQSLTAYFFIYLKHQVSPKDLCSCIRPLIHDGIVKNKFSKLLPTRYESRYNLFNSHKYRIPPVRINRAKNLFILSMCGWMNPSHNVGSSDVFA